MERDYMRDSLDPSGFVVGAKQATISFKSELKGPDDAASPETATALDPLLQACGLVPAAGAWPGDGDAGDSLIYTPTSDPAAHKSATLYYYMDGILYKMVGARGTAVATFSVRGYPSIQFNMTGLYAPAADQANPSATFEEHTPPNCLSAGLKIGSYSPVGIEQAQIDFGIGLSEKRDLNSSTGLTSLVITSRTPKITLDCDVVPLASFNPEALWSAATKSAIDWQAGLAPGNRVMIKAANAQMEEPSRGDRDGRAIYNLSFTCTQDNSFQLITG